VLEPLTESVKSGRSNKAYLLNSKFKSELLKALVISLAEEAKAYIVPPMGCGILTRGVAIY
jgi:hypothetical protein